MTRSRCTRLLVAALIAWCLSAAASGQVVPPKSLDDIFAPVVVGTPPVNAFNGLFRCSDGEIRHYGDDGFLFSRDNGLTWKHGRFGDVDASGKAAGGGRPLGMNPKTGTFTNRDACHAAISEDDGRTSIGFRELRLNPWRNAGDVGKRATHELKKSMWSVCAEWQDG